jgi:2-haloacid dehalogenase
MTGGRSKGNKGQIGWRQLIAAGTASMTLAGLGGSALARQQNTSESPDLSGVEALTFDVFGTVVDWRTSIIREGELLGQRKGIEIDWEAFADAWRAGYGPAMNRVRTGELPWTKIDGLHRLILDDLLEQFEIRGLAPEEIDDLNRVWHRLLP